MLYELNGGRGGPNRAQKWTCPYCFWHNRIKMSGRILTITANNII